MRIATLQILLHRCLKIRNAITLNAFKISSTRVFSQGPLRLHGIEFLRTYYQVNHTDDH